MAKHPLAITGDQVDFQIDAAAGLQVAQGGDGNGMRNQVDRKVCAVGDILDIIGGEAHPLDGDRTFACDVAREGLGRANDEQV